MDGKDNFVYRHLPLFGGLTGIVAVLSICWPYALIPSRVSSLEEHDRLQDSRLANIEVDNSQRREALATALAMISQINDRTKRIEDHLIPQSK